MDPKLNPLTRLHPRAEERHVSRNRTSLITGRDGFIDEDSDEGLYVFQTRTLSRYRYTINEQPPYPVALANVAQHSWLGYYIAPPPDSSPEAFAYSGQGEPKAAQYSIEMRIYRSVGDGMHEDVDITNYTQQQAQFSLVLDLETDFADQEEVGRKRQQQGELTRDWQQVDDQVWELRFNYQVECTHDNLGETQTRRARRGLTVRIEKADSPPIYQDGKIRFELDLQPGDSWHSCVYLIASRDGRELPLRYSCRSLLPTDNDFDQRQSSFLEHATEFETAESHTLSAVVHRALERSKSDLAALRLYDLDSNERDWTLAAGLPIFVSLWGRDPLTASWQSAMASPAVLRGTLPEIARLQGTEENDWYDEQPGRMIHEVHTGLLAELDLNPMGRYYSSITSSTFFPVAVSELWHWTGDKERVAPLVDPALRALRWLDQYADLDGNGLYEYSTRSPQGVKHQAWKDSPDAIVDEAGNQVDPPLGTCEEQGFVYAGKLHLSEVLWWLGRRDEAKQLYQEAYELKQRFNEHYWIDDEGFFALGLDTNGRLIRSVTSNPGHCLATGIVETDRILATAQRLMQPDLFSGWGVRTLSTKNPAYNPYSYHRGAVWPVENATFALGMLRCGLHEPMHQFCKSMFQAVSLFDFDRLPEVLSGHPRDAEHPFPAFYPKANSPQAWSASSIFLMVQAMLGLYPYAPLNLLLVDPQLPEWLPQLTLRNLHVGDAVVAIRFERKANGASTYRVLDKQGSLHVVRQPSPWSMTASYGERLQDVLSSLLPRK